MSFNSRLLKQVLSYYINLGKIHEKNVNLGNENCSHALN
jgi:hypothetical protein